MHNASSFVVFSQGEIAWKGWVSHLVAKAKNYPTCVEASSSIIL